MNLLLDSKLLIDVLRRRDGSVHFLRESALRGERLTTTAINLGETYSFLLPREESDAEALFDVLEIYPVTVEVARDAGRLRYAWARRGVTLALSDTIVAATALAHGLTIVTRNRKDFPMPELTFFDLP